MSSLRFGRELGVDYPPAVDCPTVRPFEMVRERPVFTQDAVKSESVKILS
jgi:hypothetical protein